jgi:hypothetical protein
MTRTMPPFAAAIVSRLCRSLCLLLLLPAAGRAGAIGDAGAPPTVATPALAVATGALAATRGSALAATRGSRESQRSCAFGAECGQATRYLARGWRSSTSTASASSTVSSGAGLNYQTSYENTLPGAVAEMYSYIAISRCDYLALCARILKTEVY